MVSHCHRQIVTVFNTVGGLRNRRFHDRIARGLTDNLQGFQMGTPLRSRAANVRENREMQTLWASFPIRAIAGASGPTALSPSVYA